MFCSIKLKNVDRVFNCVSRFVVIERRIMIAENLMYLYNFCKTYTVLSSTFPLTPVSWL
jgi:hypothetical protein